MSSNQLGWSMLDNIFSSQRPLFSLSPRIWNPPVDVSETPQRILIRMEIAGLRPDNFSVTVEDGILIIRGRRCDRAPEDVENFHVMEIRYGCFERAFRLPREVDTEAIQARYRFGFLDIEIPKGSGSGSSVRIAVREE